jgi:hypothetical protein
MSDLPGISFTGQHKAQFQELLAVGELYAINRHGENLDVGPWSVEGDHDRDSDAIDRLKTRFCAAVRKAALAAGAPPRVNRLDWWICKLARGKRRPYIKGLIQRSIEYCEDLEGKAFELGRLPNEVSGLRRDSYPLISWLYDHDHDSLPDPRDELEYWTLHIWQRYRELIGHYARLVDEDQRAGRPIWEHREQKLDNAIVGLSYDLAVLQANYVVDRGLRGDEGVGAFHDEAGALLEQLESELSASRESLALSDDNAQDEQVKHLAQMFKQVGHDLRGLFHVLPPAVGPHDAPNKEIPPTAEGKEQPPPPTTTENAGCSNQAADGRSTESKLLAARATGQVRLAGGPAPVEPVPPGSSSAEDDRAAAIAERAARRQAVVMPILANRHWKKGKLVTKSGVGKATVYGYLDGTRSWIEDENRTAIAQTLDLELNQLPD